MQIHCSDWLNKIRESHLQKESNLIEVRAISIHCITQTISWKLLKNFTTETFKKFNLTSMGTKASLSLMSGNFLSSPPLYLNYKRYLPDVFEPELDVAYRRDLDHQKDQKIQRNKSLRPEISF